MRFIGLILTYILLTACVAHPEIEVDGRDSSTPSTEHNIDDASRYTQMTGKLTKACTKGGVLEINKYRFSKDSTKYCPQQISILVTVTYDKHTLDVVLFELGDVSTNAVGIEKKN